MEKLTSKFNLYLIGIFTINLFQSVFTPIIGDEAYYWVYSQDLNWGYFDHPPAIALLIKLSSIFFSSELGIRLMTVLLNSLTILVIWKLIPKENKGHKYSELIFFTLLLAIPGFNIYGFITTPDAPLIFFFSLYLLVFRRLINKNTLLNAGLLGLCAALLIYSKYHGAILILLSIILRLDFLKRGTTYFAGAIALLLISPHIYWQYSHDFITFDYHLFQRTKGVFDISNVGEYLLGMLGILNPFLIVFLAVQVFKNKEVVSIENKFFFYMFLGIIIFFFIYSFRSKIETHWTVSAFIPMVIILHHLFIKCKKCRKGLWYIGIVSIILLFTFRIILILPVSIKSEFHMEGKDFFEAISKEAAGKPVVFVNSYQKASKYSFYTGEKSYTFTDIDYRKSQYNIGNYEEEFRNKKVFLVGNWPSSFFDTLRLETGDEILYTIIDKYPVFSKVKASILNYNPEFYKNPNGKIKINITNPYSFDIDFKSKNMPYQMFLILSKDEIDLYVPLYPNIEILEAETSITVYAGFKFENIQEDTYDLSIAIKPGYLYSRIISRKYKINVK